MASLRFLRRDRRQRDPFASAPVTCRACSPEDFGPCACPRPCGWMGCMGERNEAAAKPHGIATPETLAALVEQAQAEQQTATMAQPPWGPWDQPGSFPEALRARDAGEWYGWDTTAMDVPPAHHRRYAPDPLTAPLPRATLSFAADFAQLPVFRAACRAAGHAPAGRVRGGFPALPDFRIGEMMHHRFAGMLAMHPGLERAA